MTSEYDFQVREFRQIKQNIPLKFCYKDNMMYKSRNTSLFCLKSFQK